MPKRDKPSRRLALPSPGVWYQHTAAVFIYFAAAVKRVPGRKKAHLRMRLRLGVALADQLHLAAQAPDGVHLDVRRRQRHADQRAAALRARAATLQPNRFLFPHPHPHGLAAAPPQAGRPHYHPVLREAGMGLHDPLRAVPQPSCQKSAILPGMGQALCSTCRCPTLLAHARHLTEVVPKDRPFRAAPDEPSAVKPRSARHPYWLPPLQAPLKHRSPGRPETPYLCSSATPAPGRTSLAAARLTPCA